MKEDNYEKLSQKEEKKHVLDFQECTEKRILKLATLKISSHLNIHQLREEHNEVQNTAKENGITETIE